MGSYILNILKAQWSVFFSWGPTSLKFTNNGLRFRVNGFLHKGIVVVEYDDGSDLFNLKLMNDKCETIQVITDIYADQLVDVIDSVVEKDENYENKISDLLNDQN